MPCRLPVYSSAQLNEFANCKVYWSQELHATVIGFLLHRDMLHLLDNRQYSKFLLPTFISYRATPYAPRKILLPLIYVYLGYDTKYIYEIRESRMILFKRLSVDNLIDTSIRHRFIPYVQCALY